MKSGFRTSNANNVQSFRYVVVAVAKLHWKMQEKITV